MQELNGSIPSLLTLTATPVQELNGLGEALQQLKKRGGDVDSIAAFNERKA